MATTTKLRGVVKKVKRQEGFAFLSHEATGEDYFMHRSVIEHTSEIGWDDLEEGMKAEWVPVDAPKGPRAIEVRITR